MHRKFCGIQKSFLVGDKNDGRYSSPCENSSDSAGRRAFDENRNVGENEALRIICASPIADLLEDDSMGLYGQSALYIYSLIDE